jgi:hypothetical protein
LTFAAPEELTRDAVCCPSRNTVDTCHAKVALVHYTSHHLTGASQILVKCAFSSIHDDVKFVKAKVLYPEMIAPKSASNILWMDYARPRKSEGKPNMSWCKHPQPPSSELRTGYAMLIEIRNRWYPSSATSLCATVDTNEKPKI